MLFENFIFFCHFLFFIDIFVKKWDTIVNKIKGGIVMGYDYYGYDSSAYAAAGVTAFLGVYSVVLIAIAVIQIVAQWKLFTKAGEKGWKSIIPIYNYVILFKISGLSPWLLFILLASVIPFVGWIAVVALMAVLAYKLAKSFGKDGGWAVGLYFLPSIFYMILAFGKSTYVGPGGESTVVTKSEN